MIFTWAGSKRSCPGLNAAFVDVGYEKDAFLHYLDLGPQVQSLLKLTKQVRSGGYQSKLLDNFKLEADINKGGKISEVLTKNQLIPVQIAKEPISTKGPALKFRLIYSRALCGIGAFFGSNFYLQKDKKQYRAQPPA